MSSFKKRVASNQPKLPPGTKLSSHNGQVLVSTGVSSLDDVLGGGLPVGSILLVLSDRKTNYSRVLTNYFVAQGLASSHHVHVASVEENIRPMLKRLPSWCPEVALANTKVPEPREIEAEQSPASSEKLKIAWRYQNLPTSSHTTTPAGPRSERSKGPVPFCENFDLMQPVNPEVLDQPNLTTSSLDSSVNDHYQALFSQLAGLVENGFSSLAPVPATGGRDRNIIRLAIHDMASPLWHSSSPESCFAFLHALRGLLRFSFATCMITVPAHLYQRGPQKSGFIRRMEHLCDAVVELESFAGSRGTKAMGDLPKYHGFFYVHKQPLLNSLVPSSTRLSAITGTQLSANNLAFKQKRHKFVIETFYLPPEGGVSERRVAPSKDGSQSSTSSVQNKPPQSLDF
ncbi:Elongator subunit elp4 [Dispira parvispora]|uniref:Elongator complex protein 4 n=1 Tax=Dispira parvispora TaxID=1520584 RepID=A0A9W8AVS0_9FUNG|nr:Elongator subunit elp4 [Dispira parvispora]